MAKTKTSVVRVATLLIEGHAPVTRVDTSPGLSSRSLSTLRKWFGRQFGTLPITRWRFKQTPGMVEVRGIVEAATPRPQPRPSQSIKAPKAAKAKPAAPPTVATLARKERREAYHNQAVTKRATPRKVTALTSKKPYHPPQQRKTAQPRWAATAPVEVVSPLGKSFGLGFCGTVLDQGLSQERLMKGCRKLMQQHGITAANAVHLAVHFIADQPETRVVVIYARQTSCKLVSLSRASRQTKAHLATWLYDNAESIAATCGDRLADDDARLQRHQERTKPRKPKPSFLPSQPSV